jgi:hypothetical protein
MAEIRDILHAVPCKANRDSSAGIRDAIPISRAEEGIVVDQGSLRALASGLA